MGILQQGYTSPSLHSETWHDTTSNYKEGMSSASVSFIGTAVYVQVVLPGTQHQGLLGKDAEYYFSINGTRTSSFIQKILSSDKVGHDGYAYNVTALALPDLPWGTHYLTIDVGHPGGKEVLMLLDSITYTYDDAPAPSSTLSPTSPSPSPSNRVTEDTQGKNNPKLIASIIIPLALLAITLSLVTLWLLRRKRRTERTFKMQLTPLPYTEVFRRSPYHTTTLTGSSFPNHPPPELAGLLGPGQSSSTLHPRQWDVNQWQHHSQSLNNISKEILYHFNAPYSLVPHNQGPSALSSLPSAVPRSVSGTIVSNRPEPPPYSKVRR
jgi:hypothetical protein